MEINRLIYLLENHNKNALSAGEREELDSWYGSLQHELPGSEQELLNSTMLTENMLADLRSKLPAPASVPLRSNLYKKLSVAAAILVVAGTSVYLGSIKKNDTVSAPAAKVQDVMPGTNSAVLTLADGTKVSLNNASGDTVLQQGMVKVVKYANGNLGYLAGNTPAEEILYNTISTPNGAQYKLTLPDGSIAWLNAASSIYFPTTFSANERAVSVTGEVYFDVVSYTAGKGGNNIPFKVSVNGMEIAVLGTKFNVKAYNDGQALKTTLVEGSVQLASGTDKVLLKPGNMAKLKSNNQFTVIANADQEEELAWIKNRFVFNNTNIKDIMKDVARWYDLEVAYKSDMSDEYFTGKISRDQPLSQIIKKLQLTNTLQFKLEGKQLIISN